MGELSSRIEVVGKTVQRGLERNGWDERPTSDRRLYGSARIATAHVLPNGIIVGSADVQHGSFGDRVKWSVRTPQGSFKRLAVIGDGSLSVVDTSLSGVTLRKFTISDNPDTPIRPFYDGEGMPDHKAVRLPRHEALRVLGQLEAVVAPLNNRR